MRDSAIISFWSACASASETRARALSPRQYLLPKPRQTAVGADDVHFPDAPRFVHRRQETLQLLFVELFIEAELERKWRARLGWRPDSGNRRSALRTLRGRLLVAEAAVKLETEALKVSGVTSRSIAGKTGMVQIKLTKCACLRKKIL